MNPGITTKTSPRMNYKVKNKIADMQKVFYNSPQCQF